MYAIRSYYGKNTAQAMGLSSFAVLNNRVYGVVWSGGASCGCVGMHGLPMVLAQMFKRLRANQCNLLKANSVYDYLMDYLKVSRATGVFLFLLRNNFV